MSQDTQRRTYLLSPSDHFTLTEAQFGMPGLNAIESIGPFVEIQASGPLIMVHDATVDAGLGIGHHPHRFNERLFYIEAGELDHDDALNKITGHMDTGDVGQFTEGQRGMVHSEWNNGTVDAKAYILVYSTDPVPPHTAFNVLKDGDAPRYSEGEGVETKELVGSRSPLEVNGDIRFFADTTLEAGASVSLTLGASEGGLVSVRSGAVAFGASELEAGTTIVIPPGEDAERIEVRAMDQGARVIRVTHGTGHGFILGQPRF